jgi:hypothetical protein
MFMDRSTAIVQVLKGISVNQIVYLPSFDTYVISCSNTTEF